MKTTISCLAALAVLCSVTFVAAGCEELPATVKSEETVAPVPPPPPPPPPAPEPEVEECTDSDHDCVVGMYDCDEEDGSVSWFADEVCDGADNNCDGETDEGFESSKFYRDFDKDGYGSSTNFVEACGDEPPMGYVAKAGDCNDGDAETKPDADDEGLDGLDQDCDDLEGAEPWVDESDDDESDESDPAAKPGSLELKTSKKDRLQFDFHFFATASDVGGDWNGESIVKDWADQLGVKFLDVAGYCGLRFSLKIGGGSGETWSCLTDGEGGGKVNPLLTELTLKIGAGTADLADVQIWTTMVDGEDQCSLVLTWGEACNLP